MNAKLTVLVVLVVVALPALALAQRPATRRSPVTVAARRSGRIACLGDSITVGYGPRFTAFDGAGCAVYAEVGRPTREMLGVLRRSIIGHGFDTVVVLGGTNDVVRPGGDDDALANLQAIYREAKASGLRVIAVTVPPMGGSHPRGARSPALVRAGIDRLNEWIRSNAEVDAVVDAHEALSDRTRPDRIDPTLVRRDRIHPNAVGQAWLAAAVAKGVSQQPQPPQSAH